MFFPEDDNGIVLRRMAAQGKDLTKARNIDFAVVFVDSISAEQFAEYFRALGHKVSVVGNESTEEFPLGCSCRQAYGAYLGRDH